MTNESAAITLKDLQEFYPHGGLGSSLVPLPDYSAIYVRNPKAACSTIKLWLTRAYTGDREFNPVNIHSAEALLLPRPRDVGWTTVFAMLGGSAFRWSFVRHPVMRAESAYRDKVVRQPALRLGLQRALGLPADQSAEVSLDMFVDALELIDPLDMDVHFRPQHLNLMDGLVEYDLIGRIESFDTDLARLCGAVGIPDVPVEIRNRQSRPGETLLGGRPDLQDRLATIYARDFELYGY